jgi:hypothetical protein
VDTNPWLTRIARAGRTISDRWADVENDPAEFGRVALDTVRESELHRGFAVDVLYELLSDRRDWPAQSRLPPEPENAEPNLTLYRDPENRFLIDLNLWLNGNTAIHDHTTAAANFLLMGRSVYSAYSFENVGALGSSGMLVGQRRLTHLHLGFPGDGYHFPPGPAFIHRVHHLDSPTASLVILLNPTSVARNRVYLTPHLAAQISLDRQRLARDRKILWDHLMAAEGEAAVAYLTDVISEEQGLAAVELLQHGRTRNLSEPRLIDALDPKESTAWRNHLGEVLFDFAFENWIVRAHDAAPPEHRLVAALLQTCGLGRQMMTIIRQLFPLVVGPAVVADWFDEMIQGGQLSPKIGEPLAIALRRPNPPSSDEIQQHLEAQSENDRSVLIRLGWETSGEMWDSAIGGDSA